MNKKEALDLLRRGQSGIWNEYRKDNPNWQPDLEGEDLSQINFAPEGKQVFDLKNANLVGCKLPRLSLLLPREIQFDDSAKGYRSTVQIRPNANVAEVLGSHPDAIMSSSEISKMLGGRKFTITRQLGKISNPFSGHLSEVLIDRTTSMADGTDLDTLVQLGARFVTRDGLKRERAEVSRRLFISYAWVDEQAIKAIEQWLRQKGLATIMDKRNFFAGEQIRDEIMRGMQSANAILLFHSKKTAKKPWIEFERELAKKFKRNATRKKSAPPQIIFVVLDDTPLPDSEKDRIAIMAKGKKFQQVCQEIYDSVLRLPRTSSDIDLSKWDDFVFTGKSKAVSKKQTQKKTKLSYSKGRK